MQLHLWFFIVRRVIVCAALMLAFDRISLGQQTCPAVNFYSGQSLNSYANGQALGFAQVMGSYKGYAASNGGGTPVALPQLLSQLLPCYPNPNRKVPPANGVSAPSATPPGQLVAVGDITGQGGFGGVYASGSINGTGITAYQLDISTLALSSQQYVINGSLGDAVVLADFNGDQIPDIGALTLIQGTSATTSSVVLLFGKGDGTFDAPVYLPVDQEVGGITAVDVNGDGKADLILSGASAEVWLSKGDGTFQAPVMIGAPAGQTALGALTAAAGDMNNDGKIDLVFATQNGVAVALGSGSGSFQAPVLFVPGGSTQIAELYAVLGDFNHDGILDVASVSQSAIQVWQGKGDGNLTFTGEYVDADPPWSLVLADLDGDGNLDILSATGSALAFSGITNTGETLTVLYGNGDGTFLGLPITPLPFSSNHLTGGIVSGDFNADGKPDVALFGNDQIQTLFGGGVQFAAGKATTLSSLITGLAAGDFNGDQKTDLAASTQTGITILTGAGDGSFVAGASYPLSSTPTGIMAGDLNGDGKPDLVTFSAFLNSFFPAGTTQVSVLLNQGAGTFGSPQNYPFAEPASVLIGDFNGDGKPDLAVVSLAVTNSDNVVTTPGSVSIMLGNGTGSFQTPQPVANTATAILIAAGDLNGDGKTDLAVISQNPDVTWSLSIFLGNVSGGMDAGQVFTEEFGPVTPVIADFNGDGKADLLVPYCCGPGTSATIRLGNGDGTLGPEISFANLNSVQAAIVADFNGDGKPDVAGSQYNGVALAINASQKQGSLTTVSAAGFAAAPVASDSIASLFGSGLATSTASAQSTPLPAIINGTSASITDSTGSITSLPLFFVSPGQVNAYIPPSVPTGTATVSVTAGDGTISSGNVQIANFAPGMFLLNAAGLAAAQGLRVVNGVQVYFPVYQAVADGSIIPAPIDLSQGTVYLVLYTTGVRHETTLSQVTATVGGVNAPVLFAGAQSGFVGLDQVNVQLPAALAGKGDVEILLTVGGVKSNVAHVTIQ